MHAVTIRDGALVLEEHPDPQPGTGEVLVRVRAAGLNGGDQMQVRGLYPPPPGWPQSVAGLTPSRLMIAAIFSLSLGALEPQPPSIAALTAAAATSAGDWPRRGAIRGCLPM